MQHFQGNPAAAHRPCEGLRGIDHADTLYDKVLCVKKNDGVVVVKFEKNR
jgi:hypothetical protein